MVIASFIEYLLQVSDRRCFILSKVMFEVVKLALLIGVYKYHKRGELSQLAPRCSYASMVHLVFKRSLHNTQNEVQEILFIEIG